MKHSLQHLPEHKQAEITRIVEIIKEVVNPEMIILFGSYAKGTYVEHRYVSKGITYEYISDYDFLVVTKDNSEKSYVQESRVMDLAERFKPPLNLEIHEIEYINKGLELGEYFFVDIVEEGVLLYNKETVQFAQPRELTQAEKKEKAQRYFRYWFPEAGEFLIDAQNAANRNNLRKATFYLHQGAENLYYSTLLVFTDYKPKTHNLWKLRKKAKPYSEELFLVFRAETDKQERDLFELLKQGYVDARYREDFTIVEPELITLIHRVSSMIPIVEKICQQRITDLEAE
ncbi:MAG: HEPN domain-containing protein [Chitinophagaceae bacterium]|nr:MAG: HEPN domain-containing protein [Chitinophagaceae bacterium]